MRGVAYFCFVSAAVYAVAGMALGIFMAASHDHGLSPVHAHLNLVGWVSLGVVGLYYHAVPAAAAGRLAVPHVALATLGLWLLVPGIALVYLGGSEVLAIAGSLTTIVAMALFVVIVAIHRQRSGAAA